MNRITQLPKVELDVTIRLTAEEVMALDALAGYGIKGFLEVFYKHMGRHYLEPHEAGLRSLFETIRSDLPPIINRLQNARRAFVLANPVIRSREDHEAVVARAVAAAVKASRETPSS